MRTVRRPMLHELAAAARELPDAVLGFVATGAEARRATATGTGTATATRSAEPRQVAGSRWRDERSSSPTDATSSASGVRERCSRARATSRSSRPPRSARRSVRSSTGRSTSRSSISSCRRWEASSRSASSSAGARARRRSSGASIPTPRPFSRRSAPARAATCRRRSRRAGSSGRCMRRRRGEAALPRALAALMIDALHAVDERVRAREQAAVLSRREREVLDLSRAARATDRSPTSSRSPSSRSSGTSRTSSRSSSCRRAARPPSFWDGRRLGGPPSAEAAST